jgi:hypothetical protein
MSITFDSASTFANLEYTNIGAIEIVDVAVQLCGHRYDRERNEIIDEWRDTTYRSEVPRLAPRDSQRVTFDLRPRTDIHFFQALETSLEQTELTPAEKTELRRQIRTLPAPSDREIPEDFHTADAIKEFLHGFDEGDRRQRSPQDHELAFRLRELLNSWKYISIMEARLTCRREPDLKAYEWRAYYFRKPDGTWANEEEVELLDLFEAERKAIRSKSLDVFPKFPYRSDRLHELAPG